MNFCIYISLDQQKSDIEINHPHNSGTIGLFLRNLRYYEGLEKYDNVEIKIFDNFGDIETRYKTDDIITKIKKDNTEIVKILKQNKKNISF